VRPRSGFTCGILRDGENTGGKTPALPAWKRSRSPIPQQNRLSGGGIESLTKCARSAASRPADDGIHAGLVPADGPRFPRARPCAAEMRGVASSGGRPPRYAESGDETTRK